MGKLRILSDMKRPEEEDGGRAGANLVKVLQDEFDSKFPVTIFCGHAQSARTKLSDVGAHVTAGLLDVTVSAMEAVKFASWEDEFPASDFVASGKDEFPASDVRAR